ALHDITLDVFEGESIGIIGPNGAGKSTLLLHLNGILKGNSHIRIFDIEVNDKNLTHIRSKVGLVFQDPDNQLFMPTVFDDVAFGPINMLLPKNEVKLSVEGSLKEVDMLGSIGRASHHLSFGEKKRVSIATVLSMKPEIMALDEPTSNLDPKARYELIRFLKSIDKTKIIVSHDLDMILDICNRVVILDKGVIVADGNTKAILSNAPLLENHNLFLPLCLKNSKKKELIINK
ncbi:MAG: ABC transporter ATP-binding protein, partial [Candidatus Zapsychrus exili]|nr:ABC transporter ATP-binding protein [Candidatus Zapsychrus exili]